MSSLLGRSPNINAIGGGVTTLGWPTTFPGKILLSTPNTDEGDNDGVRFSFIGFTDGTALRACFHSVSFVHIILWCAGFIVGRVCTFITAAEKASLEPYASKRSSGSSARSTKTGLYCTSLGTVHFK